MTDPDDPDQYPKLAELNVGTVRSENEYVDERMDTLESQVSDLEQQVADLESEKADIESEKEATEKLLAQFRDDQRTKQLNRIKEANEQVDDEDEVDLSTLEDASVDQLETVADLVESASATAEVSNRGDGPDLSNVDPGEEGSVEDEMARVAEQEGMLGLYQDAIGASEQDSSSGPSLDDLLEAYENNNDNAGGAF